MNKQRVWTILLVAILLLATLGASEQFIIVPNESTGECLKYPNKTCVTLESFVSNSSTFISAIITLSFLPGDHALTEQFAIDDAIDVVLSGHACNITHCDTKVECSGTNASFSFKGIETVEIARLEFLGCNGSPDAHGGALSFRNITNVSILESRFLANSVSSWPAAYGGAVHIDAATSVLVDKSYFANNSIRCLKSPQIVCDSYEFNGGGAVSLLNSISVVIQSSHFESNTANTNGGAILSYTTNLTVTNTVFVHNNALIGGVIYINNSRNFDYNSSLPSNETCTISTNNTYISNLASRGGVMYVWNGCVSSKSETYLFNQASMHGGAIYIGGSALYLSDSIFGRSLGVKSGGAIYLNDSSVHASSCYFDNNRASEAGGAIYAAYSLVSTFQGNFTNNIATNGGAIYAFNTSVTSNNTFYSSSRADMGGAVYVLNGSIHSFKSNYTHNLARLGGAIFIFDGPIYTNGSNFYGNHAYNMGGGLYVSNTVLYAFNCQHTSNGAEFGGAIFANSSSIHSQNSTYTANIANQEGAVIFVKAGSIISSNSLYRFNSAKTSNGGAMYAIMSSIFLSSDTYLRNSGYGIGGAVALEGSQATCLESHFLNNTANYGGAIEAHNSSVNTTSCSYAYNRARGQGGAIYLYNSAMLCSRNTYSYNDAENSGGAIGLYQSSINTSHSIYSNNRGDSGGAISSLSSQEDCVLVSVNNTFSNNAGDSGGAILTIHCNTTIVANTFSSNIGTAGGAIASQTGTMTVLESIFEDNFAREAGGGIVSRSTPLSVSDTRFFRNSAIEGGAILASVTELLLSQTNFTENIANKGGAVFKDRGILVISAGCHYLNNSAIVYGGAIIVSGGNITAMDSLFFENKARLQGSVIALDRGSLSMSNCYCSSNVASNSIGGLVYVSDGFVSILNSVFTDNFGGVIHISEEGSIISVNSYYKANTAQDGGVMYINYGKIHISNSSFVNNSATNGGAIYLKTNGNLSTESTSYIANVAMLGGAIFAGKSSHITTSTNSHFDNNVASVAGGAIYSSHGTTKNTETLFTNNTSGGYGGATFQYGGSVLSLNTSYIRNLARKAGGAVCSLSGSIATNNSTFVNNFAAMFGGAVYSDSCPIPRNLTQSVFEKSTPICTKFENDDNFNLRLSTSSKEDIFSSTKFANNTSDFVGGAISSILHRTSVDSFIKVSGNHAAYGGGLALAGDMFRINCPLTFQQNVATESGGGMYAYSSEVQIYQQAHEISKTATTLQDNLSENTSFEKNSGFFHNDARLGGAIYFDQNSKLYLMKRNKEENGTKLNFTGNSAHYGGAVYVSDKNENQLSCERGIPGNLEKQECFVQTLLSNYSEECDNLTLAHFINVFFTNNTARFSGDDIYGGLLDRCVLNPSAELVRVFPEHVTFTGFEYIRATSEFYGLVDYDNLTSSYDPDKLINAISRSNIKGLISSDPLRVCFCSDHLPNCSYYHKGVHTKRGQLFHLSVVAVDQVGNPVNATVISSFISNNGDLNVDQARQDTYAQCTELEYNVFPKGDSKSSQLELYADGPCTDLGISKRVLDVIFLSCTCPIGFHPVETETLCRCECDPILRSYILGCSYENETIILDTNAWIDYVNTSTRSGYIIYDPCPFDYCVQETINVNLNVPNGADVQCAFNRSGKLCGACKENLSLVMGSSRCMECSDDFLSLIIPFTLAGIALVAFILILNLTVATGTLHGLIFYANILAASSSTFMPIDTPVFLKVFVSWINLDLGIETCFYNGMDSYGKVLLQLVFPVYIILLSVLIIIISEHSIRFAMVLGRKDPVATLSTLILLSYSKLIRTIIASLQYTYLDYPDGSREIVWLYNANVPYFKISHIPRFIIASVIIILGSVYTVLLLFGQWIPRCENRFVRWANNPKYNAFIIKYHAPFNPKHRYWIGLLLFARILHYIVAAFVSESAILLSVICIVLCLLIFKIVVARRGYKNWSLNSLESSFLLNLGIFAAVTYYISQSAETNQAALAGISLAVTFLTFVGILIYHFYAYILKGTQLWDKITQFKQRLRDARNRQPLYEPLPEPEPGEDEELANGEVNRQDIEMHPPYTDENEPIDLPRDYVPPVVTPAVRYSQERRELDVLDPITDNDYRQVVRRPAPRPRQVPTSTVIDITRRGGQEDGDSD